MRDAFFLKQIGEFMFMVWCVLKRDLIKGYLVGFLRYGNNGNDELEIMGVV